MNDTAGILARLDAAGLRVYMKWHRRYRSEWEAPFNVDGWEMGAGAYVISEQPVGRWWLYWRNHNMGDYDSLSAARAAAEAHHAARVAALLEIKP